jgi:hypothetical protein
MISAQITRNVWLGGSINLLATVSRNDKTSNLSTHRARKVVILSASEARRTKSRASLFLHARRTLRDPAKSLDPIVRPARVGVCIQRFAGIKRLRCARGNGAEKLTLFRHRVFDPGGRASARPPEHLGGPSPAGRASGTRRLRSALLEDESHRAHSPRGPASAHAASAPRETNRGCWGIRPALHESRIDGDYM